ncbi:ribonuclease H family protein [Limosilactobacillus sp.]|uniref:ribonuclease H family protein n=1 Tax=Limosilactobacillus sp. TaxID=2773925 RepID=UPI003EFDC385
MASKYYAVKRGRHPGIYSSWAACQREVTGYSGAIYRSFTNRQEAQAWLGAPVKNQRPSKRQQLALDLGQFEAEPAAIATIALYTDGGSRNHGNRRGQHVKENDKAAWAFLIERQGQQVTGTAGEFGATNNRMELLGLINAFKALIQREWQNETINATLDSHYVLDPIMKGWLYGWRRRGWVTSTGKAVANKELWQTLLTLLPQFPHLHFQWTKGHADNQGNNIVDELLNTTMDRMGD